MHVCIIILAPSVVDVCSTFSINITTVVGSAIGAPFIYTWVASTNLSNATEDSRITAFLNSQADRTDITVTPLTVLSSTLYTLDVTLTNQYGYSTTPQSTQIAILSNECGDGSRSCTEQCDDGNVISGDGCSSSCQVETNWVCHLGSVETNPLTDTCSCIPDPEIHYLGGACVKLDPATAETIATMGSAQVTSAQAVEGSLVGAHLFTGAAGGLFPTAMNALNIQILLKYCSAKYPPIVESFFSAVTKHAGEESSSSDSGLIPELTRLIKSIKGEKYLSNYGRFKVFGKSISFLTNAGSPLVSALGSLVMIGIIRIFKFLLKSSQKLSPIIDNLLNTFEWNMTFSFINGAQIKFTLAWCLQFGEPVFDTYGIINLVVAVLVLVAVVVVSAVSFSFSTWNWNIVQNEAFLSKKRLEMLSSRQKKFVCLWKPYILDFSFGRYFYLIQSIKNSLFVTILYVYQGHPIEQSYLLLFTSMLYIVMLVVGQPFKRTIDLASVLLNEIILMVEAALLVIFSINGKIAFFGDDVLNLIGWILIGCMLGVLGMNGVFILLSIVIPLFTYLTQKKPNTKSKVPDATTHPNNRTSAAHKRTKIREISLED